MNVNGSLDILKKWQAALVAGVRADSPDLSARQLAILMTVYTSEGPHTVRGLADLLNIAKPAVTRAVDRLSILGFVKRKRDVQDRRSVLLQRTIPGSVFLSDFADRVIAAERQKEEMDRQAAAEMTELPKTGTEA